MHVVSTCSRACKFRLGQDKSLFVNIIGVRNMYLGLTIKSRNKIGAGGSLRKNK